MTQTQVKAKNQVGNHTIYWKQEREWQMKFYQETPFYGNPLSETLYNKVKQVIPSLIQASICGINISLVTYKKDADMAAHLLTASFKKPCKQITCPYTEFITTYLRNI